MARAVRAHWHIENRLHWVLDVIFRDDLARLRTGHGPENMAIVKHMAVNLRREAKPATSLKNRRKLAGWNLDYLETSSAQPLDPIHPIAPALILPAIDNLPVLPLHVLATRRRLQRIVT